MAPPHERGEDSVRIVARDKIVEPPHERGEDSNGFTLYQRLLETPPRAWGRGKGCQQP